MASPEPTGDEELQPSTTVCDLREKPATRVQIDADGDLCLKVGHNKCLTNPTENSEEHDHEYAVIYVVDSSTVSRSSPVWRKLLNGAFVESKRPDPDSGKEWMVELPDDDPKSMLIILNIIHGYFCEVPEGGRETMPLHDLYRLTVLTDKYDLTLLLSPWAKTWVMHVNKRLDTSTTEDSALAFCCLEKCLWVSWELGDEQMFRKAYIHLVLNTRMTAGHLVGRDPMSQLFSRSNLEPSNVSGKYEFIHA